MDKSLCSHSKFILVRSFAYFEGYPVLKMGNAVGVICLSRPGSARGREMVHTQMALKGMGEIFREVSVVVFLVSRISVLHAEISLTHCIKE